MRKPFRGDFRLTQVFGNNPNYYKQFGFNGHEGIDWGMPVGTELLAAARGRVVRRNDVKDGAYGLYVVIWHVSLNLATWYCHLSQINVTIGQEVDEGQVIGKSGNTGNTTGPHLHFNLCRTDAGGTRINQNNGFKGFIDPQPYLTATTGGDVDKDKRIVELEAEVADEIKKKNETYAELQEWKVPIPAKLGTPQNVTVVLGEIDKLVNFEDSLVAKDRELEQKQAELTQLDSKVKELTDDNSVLQNDIDKLQKKTQELQSGLSEAAVKIEELKKQKPMAELSIVNLIGMIFAKIFSRR